MSATRYAANSISTSAADLTRFAIALVNGGKAGNARILQEASLRRLALPEMHRNGWRALQLDGSAAGYSTRLVIAQDAKLAYVIVVRGRPDARFWRLLDDALFDEFLPPRSGIPVLSRTVSDDAARTVSGIYEPDSGFRSLVFLKSSGRKLQVRAMAAGALRLSGAENAVLVPQQGFLWSTPDGSLTATIRNGALFLSSGDAYRALPFYRRPALYVLLGLVAVLGGFAFMLIASLTPPRRGLIALPKTFR